MLRNWRRIKSGKKFIKKLKKIGVKDNFRSMTTKKKKKKKIRTKLLLNSRILKAQAHIHKKNTKSNMNS